MLFLTFKLPPRRIRIPAIIAAATVLIALIFAFAVRGQSAETAAAAESEVRLCLDCLDGFGWQAEPTPVSAETRTLSTELSEGYLALQREAGFDLSDDMGQSVTRYSFTITNYPTGEVGILADLLVRDGAVVGGDVRSSALDGFIHSLKWPE